jgi:hypothetical protein
MSIKNKNPDASFTCAALTDGKAIVTNTEINVGDKIVITSKGKFNECGTSFAVYTGKPGQQYQTNYNMYSSNPKLIDSIQTARGEGTLLDTLNGKFVSNPISYDTKGTYVIYTVASFVDKKTGDYIQKIDSLQISVNDPSLINTLPYTFTLMGLNKRYVTYQSVIRNDSIIIMNVTTANLPNVTGSTSKGTFYTFSFTPLSLTAHYKNQLVHNADVDYRFQITEGSKISITSADGSVTKDYTISLNIFKSPDPTLQYATVANNSADFAFTGTSVISHDSIILPTWPKGTTRCSLTVAVQFVKSQIFAISKDQMPYKITATAENGVSTKVYYVYPPLNEYYAYNTGITLLNDSLHNHISGSGTAYTIFSADTNLSKSKLRLSLNPFAIIQYSSTPLDKTSFKDFYAGSTQLDILGKTIYLRVTEGTDVSLVKINGIAW